MKKILSFNLIKHELKQNWWIMLMFMLSFSWMFAILISGLQNEALSLSVVEREFTIYNTTLISVNILSSFIFFVGTVITSSLLFGYMHNKKSIDFYHSLPLKREVIFMSKYVSGIILYFVPFLLAIGITILIASAVLETNISYFSYHMLSIFVTQLIAGTLMYSIVTFFSTITGLHIIQILCFFGIAIVPNLTISLLSSARSVFLPTLGNYYFEGFNQILNKFIVRPFDLLTLKFTSHSFRNYEEAVFINEKFLYDYVWIDVILIIGICIASVYVYSIRRSENSGEPIVFNSIKGIVKYGMTICGSIIFTVFLMAVLESKSELTALISIIGFYVLFYLIMEVILNKGFLTINKNLKQMLLFLPLPLIIFSLTIFDVLGLEKKIPNLEDIESVSISNDTEIALINTSQDETVSKIMAYHNFLVNDYLNLKEPYNFQTKPIYKHTIEYTLKNGKKVNRTYNNEYMNTINYLNDVFNDKEYKNYILNLINNVHLENTFLSASYSSLFHDSIQIYGKETILNALVADIEDDEQFSLFDVIGYPAGRIHISFTLPSDSELRSLFNDRNIIPFDVSTMQYTLSFIIKDSYSNIINLVQNRTEIKPRFYDIEETIFVKKVTKEDFNKFNFKQNQSLWWAVLDEKYYDQYGDYSNYLLEFDYELNTREEKENFISNAFIYNIEGNNIGSLHNQELYLQNHDEFYIAYILDKNNSINLIFPEFVK